MGRKTTSSLLCLWNSAQTVAQRQDYSIYNNQYKSIVTYAAYGNIDIDQSLFSFLDLGLSNIQTLRHNGQNQHNSFT